MDTLTAFLARANPTKAEVANLHGILRETLEQIIRQRAQSPISQSVVEGLASANGSARAVSLLFERFGDDRTREAERRARDEQTARLRAEMALIEHDAEHTEEMLRRVVDQVQELSNCPPPSPDELGDDPEQYLADWGRSQQEQVDQLDEARKLIERTQAEAQERLEELTATITQLSSMETKASNDAGCALADRDFTFSYLWLTLFSAELSALPGGEDFVRQWAVALDPREEYRFRSMRYENPLTVEILSETGFAAASLAFLLRLIRDWSSDKRRSAALAVDAESRTAFRSELRKILIDQVSKEKLILSEHALDELMSGDADDALQKLTVTPPTVNWREISDGN